MDQDNFKGNPSNNKILIGLLLIVGGILLFINKAGFLFLPSWVFTWPVLVIGIGLIIGLQHNFRNIFWLLLVGWGAYSLIDQQMPGLNLKNYSTPIILIFIGLFFLLRRNHNHKKEWFNDKWNKRWPGNDTSNEIPIQNQSQPQAEQGEFINITSVFSGAKKVVFSKNFQGGDVTCFMGGAEIDLTQADIQGRAVIDATAVFGGVKIIVPSNWDIKVENTAAFGSVDDKRRVQNFTADTNKLLVITGTAVFGGVEITNY